MLVTGKYRLSAKLKKNIYASLIFVNTGPYGMEISKWYSYTFHLISAKRYEVIG